MPIVIPQGIWTTKGQAGFAGLDAAAQGVTAGIQDYAKLQALSNEIEQGKQRLELWRRDQALREQEAAQQQMDRADSRANAAGLADYAQHEALGTRQAEAGRVAQAMHPRNPLEAGIAVGAGLGLSTAHEDQALQEIAKPMSPEGRLALFTQVGNDRKQRVVEAAALQSERKMSNAIARASEGPLGQLVGPQMEALGAALEQSAGLNPEDRARFIAGIEDQFQQVVSTAQEQHRKQTEAAAARTTVQKTLAQYQPDDPILAYLAPVVAMSEFMGSSKEVALELAKATMAYHQDQIDRDRLAEMMRDNIARVEQQRVEEAGRNSRAENNVNLRRDIATEVNASRRDIAGEANATRRELAKARNGSKYQITPAAVTARAKSLAPIIDPILGTRAPVTPELIGQAIQQLTEEASKISSQQASSVEDPVLSDMTPDERKEYDALSAEDQAKVRAALGGK